MVCARATRSLALLSLSLALSSRTLFSLTHPAGTVAVAPRRALFYVWVIAILTFCVFAVLFATARLWEGLQATYEVRQQAIKDLILYVGTGLVYWGAAGLMYFLLMLYCYPDWEWGAHGDVWSGVLWSFMGLTIASKGGLNAAVWRLPARLIPEPTFP